ncbi:MAG: DUF2336 domain-containing protein [Proteobacteria bacterium]|nr:DUF2336 domain-containing protein [Pseudomonadota bacterium]
MTAVLTQRDVTRLLAEPSPDVRAQIAEKVSATLSDTAIAPEEIALAQDIVRILARDVEVRVRASVAQNLRHARTLPRDVALKLAHDIDTVALPLLSDSLILTDDDLRQIIRLGSGAKQQAIAARPNLTEGISHVLITEAEAPAVATLMANPTAQIADHSLDHAVTRFANDERVKKAMVHRHALPLAVSERLVHMVSQELQSHLVKHHALPPAIAADIVLSSREQEIIHLSMGAANGSLRRMVVQMHQNGRLTPGLILRALCTGDIAFFEAALAIRGDVPLGNAQLLIHDRSRKGLAALYEKAGMPESLYPVVRTAVEVVDETSFDGNERDLERFRARVISRVLTAVDNLDPVEVDYLVAKLGSVLLHAPKVEAAAAN